MPPFALAPWELPPDCDAPLVAPADFVFRSIWEFEVSDEARETEIWVRIIPYKDAFIHYFRDGEDADTGNWILSFTENHHAFSNSCLSRQHFESWFQVADLWSGSIYRLIYFNGTRYGFPGTHFITASARDFCVLRCGTSTFDEADGTGKRAPFSSPFDNHEVPAHAAAMREQLRAAFNNERSEARFALKWLHLSPEEQDNKRLQFERETLEPMRKLLSAVLQSQIEIWEHDAALLWCLYGAGYADPDWSEDKLVFTNSPGTPNSLQIPPRLERWKRAIWNNFLPCDDDWLLFALCVREWQDMGVVEVEAAPPTAHEQIEALLLLRDWWNQHFPPELFDAHNSDD